MGHCLLCSEPQALPVVQRAHAAERTLDALRIAPSDVVVNLMHERIDRDGRPIALVEHLIFQTTEKSFLCSRQRYVLSRRWNTDRSII